MNRACIVERVIYLVTLGGLALFQAGCGKDRSCAVCPPPPFEYPQIDSEQALVKVLELVYRRKDFDEFALLFANQQDAMYLFTLTDPPSAAVSWDYAEEMRIHRRMFRPEEKRPGETPVPPERWLQSVSISLALQDSFVARADVYRSSTNPGGLDPDHWRAARANYSGDVFLQLSGDPDYQVKGKQSFTVIEDRTKPHAKDPGKWLIYRWDERCGWPVADGVKAGASSASIERGCWGRIKSRYR